MNELRERLYEELDSKIGETPLFRYEGKVPNGNAIWIKSEFDNPFGSHYDRVYQALFRHHEESGDISPGDKVLETSSGSAGVSFAGIGKELGYECYVALPANGEKARERAIQEQLLDQNHLILTPGEDYVNAFPKFLRRFMRKNRDFYFLNHSMGENGRNNEVTLGALGEIASESMSEVDFNFFIPAVGNGSSVLGPSRVFNELDNILSGTIGGLIEEPSSFSMFGNDQINSAISYVDSIRTRIVPFETFQSAVLYDLKHPGKYEEEFGINPGTLSRHTLPGTSFQGINFPHIRNSLEEGLIDDVVLVSDEKMDEEYHERTRRDDSKRLVHWDTPIEDHKDVGRTTRAGINVALNIASRVEGKDMLIIGYDKADRYDV